MKWVIGVFAALIGCLVIQNTVVGATATTAPGVALKVSPGNPVALIADSGYLRRAPAAPTPPQTAQLLHAARRDPMYFEPFYALATRAESRGDHRQAISLGEAARAREPRSLAVHLLLLQEYARAGRIRDAVAEINPFVSLAGQSGPVLANALSVLARDPRGEEIVASALRSNPSWRSQFLRQASGRGEALAFRTLVSPPAGVPAADQAQDRAGFLSKLIDNRDYGRAYLAWVNFLPHGDSGNVQAIYDGNFTGLAGLPPFNWTLTSNAAATAERRSDSSLPKRTALDVNFFGSDSTTIAEEMLFVQPGAYWFRGTGSADASGSFAGRLKWQMMCLPSGTVIPLTTVDRFTGKPFDIKAPVTVPSSGCDAQRLTLLGEAGDVATLIHAQFTALALVPR